MVISIQLHLSSQTFSGLKNAFLRPKHVQNTTYIERTIKCSFIPIVSTYTFVFEIQEPFLYVIPYHEITI